MTAIDGAAPALRGGAASERARFAGCALIALLLAAAGCDESRLPKSWQLTYPRVLAQRVEVESDAARATPEPGERVRLRVLIAGSKPIERLGFQIAACVASPTNGGVPSCAGEPFARLEGVLGEDEPFGDELVVELDVPERGALGDATQVLVVGTACTDGDARLPSDAAMTGRCQGSDEPALSWLGHIEIAFDPSEYNANPQLNGEAFAFDDGAWPTAVPADPDAGVPDAGGSEAGGLEPAGPDAGVPVAVATDGELHEIDVDLGESGRERFMGAREALLLSAFTTAGALQRRFFALERDQPDDHGLTIEWHSPKPPPGKPVPERAEFLFVLRDQRGGVAFTRRSLALQHD